MNEQLLSRAAGLLAALWMGMLWTICGVVATGLFAVLDDRRLAGNLAGEFFHIATWLGLGLAVLLLALLAGNGQVNRRRLVLVALAALPPLANEFALLPVMNAARAAGNMALFGSLHLASVALFAMACLGALLLVLALTRPAT